MRKTQTIGFRNFLHNPSTKPLIKPRPLKSYSFVLFSPWAMLDPEFLTKKRWALRKVFVNSWRNIKVRLSSNQNRNKEHSHLLVQLKLILPSVEDSKKEKLTEVVG